MAGWIAEIPREVTPQGDMDHDVPTPAAARRSCLPWRCRWHRRCLRRISIYCVVLTWCLFDTLKAAPSGEKQPGVMQEKTPPLAPPIGSRWGTSAKKCQGDVVGSIDPGQFRSQAGEDRTLLGWFGNLCGGTYLEMGALDGVTFSNSHVFNKSGLRWRGVQIELDAESHRRLVRNRPDEVAVIHAGVCSEPRALHAVQTVSRRSWRAPSNGIFEFASVSHRRQYWGGETLDEVRASDMVSSVAEVECDRLDDLLARRAGEVTFFDFFSLDVEGGELEVLRSADLDRVGFGILLVEADGRDPEKDASVISLLESNGYYLLKNVDGKRGPSNNWFMNVHFPEIYRGLVPNFP